MRILLAALAAVSLAGVAMAQVVVDPPAVVVTNPTFGQELYAFVEPYLKLLLEAVVTIAVGWVAALYARITGHNIDTKMRDSLQAAITNAIGLLGQKGMTAAIDYVTKAAPDALAHFGLKPADIAQKIEAKAGLLKSVGGTVVSIPLTKAPGD